MATDPSAGTTVLRGGRVVDGTGGPARAADVVIEGDTIVAVEPAGSASGGASDYVVDLDGLVLAPGFVDIHTHYDAQVLWDPDLTPSSWHGVTSVVMGNTGYGIAPSRPTERGAIVRTLQNVEGMQAEVLEAGMGTWDFETFPEYLDQIERTSPRLNVGAFIGHTPLRIFVMGEDAATERLATPEEIATMRALVDEAVDAGAVGVATSRFPSDLVEGGRPVPSRLADVNELRDICLGMAGRGRGMVQASLGPDLMVPEAAQLSQDIGRPVSWGGLMTANANTPVAETLEAQRTHGGQVYLQISCLPGVMQIVLTDPFPFGRVAAFAEIFALPRDQRDTLYRDLAWRERAKAGIDKESNVWLPRWENMTIDETVVHAALRGGPTIGTLARERGVDPFDLLCDLALADDLRTRYRIVLANGDEEELFGLLSEPGTIIGLSDAGAHASQLCDAGYATHLLGHWVREKGALTLEQAVRRLTDEPAQAFGINGRGRIAPGLAADLVAFDPDTVGIAGRERVYDLPTGADRIVAYSQGVESVWVNGTLIRSGGTDLDGVRPGRVLRG